MHNKEYNYRQNKNFNKNSQRSQFSLLPSPTILESYEEIAPGLIGKLVDLVKSEQKSRHIVEEKRIKRTSIYIIIGQILNFLSVIAILYTSYLYFEASHDILAGIVCIIGFVFLLCVMLIPKKQKYNHKNHRFNKYRKNTIQQ